MFNFVPMLLLTIACAVYAYRSKQERLLIFWMCWSGLIHIIMEASFGVFHYLVTERATTTFIEYMIEPSPSLLSWFDPRWWATLYGQYSRYDARYAMSDPLPIVLGYVELVQGPLCFWIVWAVKTNNRFRHPVQLVLVSTQMYGTIFYFGLPIAAGKWGEWMTADLFELFVYVIILNGLWIGVPIAMMIQSFRYLVKLVPQSPSEKESPA